MKTQKFRDLIVWQKAHQLVLKTYSVTKSYPKDELFGLVSQMRRCAVSVPANIVEGYKRTGKRDKIRFYNIAESSLEELKYYFILSNDLEYMNDKSEQYLGFADEVSKLLSAYIAGLERNK